MTNPLSKAGPPCSVSCRSSFPPPSSALPASPVTVSPTAGKYEKVEITFQIAGVTAGNMQLPYDPNPPHGLEDAYTGGNPLCHGISVDAVFTGPDGNSFQQPAFFFRYYDDINGQRRPDVNNTQNEWWYPTGQTAWKVRFSPTKPGPGLSR